MCKKIFEGFNLLKMVIFGFLLLFSSATSLMAQPLSGIYTIGGTNPDYPTLAAANDALDSLGISGSVTFNIRSGTYYTSAVIIDSINGSNDTSWVTFQSETGDSSDVTIRSDTILPETHVLGTFHSDYIRLKDLTFQQFYPFVPCVILSRGHDYEILNCRIIGDSAFQQESETTLLNVRMDSNLTIRNCLFDFSRRDLAILDFQQSTVDNIFIENCEFHGGDWSLQITNADNLNIIGCRIIGSYFNSGANILINLNSPRRLTIKNNYVTHLGGGSREVQGLRLSSHALSPEPSFIVNNVFIIRSLAFNGSAAITLSRFGRALQNGTFAHNTVRYLGSPASDPVIESSCRFSNSRIYNNILVHEFGGPIFKLNPTNFGCSLPADYNLYYTTGPISLTTGSSGSTDSTLAQHQMSWGDSNSVFAPPQFDSLNPSLSLAPEIDSGGFPIPAVPKDFLGNFRNPNFPDIGAYEVINPPIVRFPPDTTICESVDLDAGNPGSTFLWSTGDTTQSILIDSAASYWVTATNSKGSDTDTILVMIDSLVLPAYQISASSDSVCNATCVELSTSLDSNLYNLFWLDEDSIIDSGGTAQVCPASIPHTYYLSISDSGVCQKMDSVTIFSKGNLPALSISNDSSVCPGDSVRLSVSSSDSILMVEWKPLGISGSTVWISPDSSTQYQTVVEYANGCRDSGLVTVSVLRPDTPTVGLSFDTLSVSDDWAFYQWFVNGNPIVSATDTFWVAGQNGNYAVQVVDNNGCETVSDTFAFNSFSLNESFSKYVKLYPNPVDEMLKVEVSPLLGEVRFEIVDAVGQIRILKSRKTAFGEYIFEVADLPLGVYFLKASSEGTRKVSRFVKR